MGRYFVMSMRFNRRTAADFGLVPIDANTARNPSDNSIWIAAKLFDYGWGKENGFYRSPLPTCDALFDLALHSRDEEDMHGAAAMILERFPCELLRRCEALLKEQSRAREFQKLAGLFDLKTPTNRCPTANKPYEQIRSDSIRWKRIAEQAALGDRMK